jgi:hypothetical protein
VIWLKPMAGRYRDKASAVKGKFDQDFFFLTQ